MRNDKSELVMCMSDDQQQISNEVKNSTASLSCRYVQLVRSNLTMHGKTNISNGAKDIFNNGCAGEYRREPKYVVCSVGGMDGSDESAKNP